MFISCSLNLHFNEQERTNYFDDSVSEYFFRIDYLTSMLAPL